MRNLILLSVLALVGCSVIPEREPITVTQTVEVPVPVKCVVSYPQTPIQRLTKLPQTASGYEKTEAVIKELEDQRWYGKELLAALSKCATTVAP